MPVGCYPIATSCSSGLVQYPECLNRNQSTTSSSSSTTTAEPTTLPGGGTTLPTRNGHRAHDPTREYTAIGVGGVAAVLVVCVTVFAYFWWQRRRAFGPSRRSSSAGSDTDAGLEMARLGRIPEYEDDEGDDALLG